MTSVKYTNFKRARAEMPRFFVSESLFYDLFTQKNDLFCGFYKIKGDKRFVLVFGAIKFNNRLGKR